LADPSSGSSGGNASLEDPPASGEGEHNSAPPRTAAEYLDQTPTSVLHVPGSGKPCTCGECMTTRVESLLAAADESGSASLAWQFGWLAEDVTSAGGKRKVGL
jgi:hypothetical protein